MFKNKFKYFNNISNLSLWLLVIYLSTYQFFTYAYASNWPTFMGNNERTGFSYQTVIPPLTKQWEFEIQGDVFSSPVVYDGIVYIGARNGSVYALNANTGELIWDYSSDNYIDAAPSVSSNVIVFPSMDTNLYCLNRFNGEIIWKANLGGTSISSPLILNNKVYVGVGEPENSFKAFSLENGALLWSFKIGKPVNTAASTDGNNIYFGAADGKIYALNKETGNLVNGFPYQFTGGAFEMVSVAYSSGVIYSLPGHDERRLFKTRTSDGLLLEQSADLTENEGTGIYGWDWQRTASPLISTAAVYALCGSANYYLIGLDKSDLTKVLVSSVNLGSISEAGILGSAAMANDIIFLNTPDARFMIISSTGGILQQINLSTSAYSTPAISDGRVFIGTNGGKLISYKAAKYVSFEAPIENEIINDTYSIKLNFLNTDATGYSLEYSQDGEDYIFLSSSSYDGSEKLNYKIFDWDTTFISKGMYKLRFTLYGDLSPFQNMSQVEIRVNQKPLPPTNLIALDNPNDNGNKIILNWQASSSPDIIEYRVYRSSGSGYNLIGSTPTLSYLDITAITGSTFSYKITAYDGYLESDYSNISSAYSKNDNPLNDNIAPAKINNLIAIPGDKGGEIILNWTAPGDDGEIGQANYYEIKYSSNNFNWSNASIWKSSRAVSCMSGNTETEIITGLFGGVTYYFAIKTYDIALNESEISNIATTYAQLDYQPPQPPTELVVFDTPGDKGGRLTLKWKLSSDDGNGENDVYGYKIFRTIKSGIYDYNLPYAAVSKGVNGYMDTSATINVKYFYKVAAFDSTNISISSYEVSAISADNWRYVDAKNGGSLLSDDGAEIYIPPNSLNQNDTMIMIKLDSNTLQPLAKKINTLAKPTGIVYEVKFDNPATKLLNEAVVKIPYTDAEIVGMEEENLRIYQLVDNTWRIVNTSEVLFAENKVSAKINSLGIYSLMEYKPSGSLISADSVYTYPNPAKGDDVTFKFLVSEKSHITIEVYNVAGEKVAKLEKSDCPAGLVSEIIWNIRNIASGVYVYRVEAVSSKGKKSLAKKMAIVK